MLPLVISLGSAGQTTPARAAEPSRPKAKSIVTIILEIHLPTKPVCVNKTSYVLVLTRADTDILLRKGKVSHVSDEPKSGVTVESSVTNPDIGSLSPKTLISGTEPLDNPGEAVFSFNAKKTGTTILQFTPTYAGKKGKKEEIAITVVNCEYKAEINYLMEQSSHGALGVIMGHLDAVLEGDGETYRGTGTLHTDRTEAMAPCTFSTPGFDSATTITAKTAGSPDDQQLELTIEYEPAPSSATITCPIVGAQVTNTTEDPSNWLATNATVSETGGTRSFPIDYAQWFGRLIITVEPVDSASS
jgi:FlaG/FlaF family flagellin (archaellin)